MNKLTTIIIIIAATLLAGCKQQSHKASYASEALHYASLLDIEKHTSYTKVDIRNPWDTTHILHTYILVPKTSSLPEPIPQGTLVRTPLNKAVVYSSVHCALLDELGAQESIAGVCDLGYIDLPFIKNKARNGTIIDCGSSMQPNVERIISLSPDAILLSPFENSGGYGAIEKLGVPLIECADYMETSPLARAEWIKFFGMLVDNSNQADSIFSHVETEYNSIHRLVAKARRRPRLMCDLPQGQTWYTAGGRSTMGIMYRDAGADYIFSRNRSNGSVPCSVEQIVEQGHNADIWLLKYASASSMTYAQLQNEVRGAHTLQAFRQKSIFGCNTLTSGYYEQTPFHPELLLENLAHIVHPEIVPTCRKEYFKPLQ